MRTSPRDALIADSTPPGIRGRAFGFHRAMDHLGAAIGPLLAAAFLFFWPGHLRTLFLITLVPGLILVVLLAWGLREEHSQSLTAAPVRLSLRPVDHSFRVYLLALVLFTLGNASDAFLLVRASEVGVQTKLLPVLWCVFHVAKSAGNLAAGRAVDRFGPRPMILAGWAVYAATYLAFGFSESVWQVWVLFLIYALFYALTEPAEKTLVTMLAGAERKGLAFGLFNFAIGIAALPSSVVFGWLYEQFGALTAFGWGACLAVVASLLLLRVRTPAAIQA